MAVTLAQKVQGGTNSGTFASKQTKGNLNVAFLGWQNDTSKVVSVADTSGNPYTQALAATFFDGGSNHMTLYVFYSAGIKAAAANGNTVTVVTTTSPPGQDLFLAEFAGTPPGVSVDTVNTGTGTNGRPTASLITGHASELLLGWCVNFGFTAATPQAPGWTVIGSATANDALAQFREITVSGPYNANTILQSGATWLQAIVALNLRAWPCLRASGKPVPLAF